jgi:DNA-binding MarR family transcriptional regulator
VTESNFSPGDINGLYDHAGYWLNRLQAEMHGQLERRLAEHGVTAAQWGVLIALHKGASETVRGLATFLNVDGGAVTRLIDRLEGKGLVQRRVDRADRRSVILSLTEAGQALTPLLAQAADEHDAAILQGLTAAERRQFMGALSRLLAAQGIEPSGRPFEAGNGAEKKSKPAKRAERAALRQKEAEDMAKDDEKAKKKNKDKKGKKGKKAGKDRKDRKDKKVKKAKKDKKKKGKKKKGKK